MVTGVARFTYNQSVLYSRIEFLTVAVGLFALDEVFKTILEKDYKQEEISKINRIISTKEEMKDSAAPIARGSILGFLLGVLPGAGATLSSFFAYSLEKKVNKKTRQIRKGYIAGVAAPESANNAASGGAMIPLLTLGIPGSGTTAILMGALIMYNVQPDPLLFRILQSKNAAADCILGNFRKKYI